MEELTKNMFWIKTWNYVRENKWFSFFWSFMLVAVAFKAFLGIDFTLPCFFNYFFEIRCLGCGLTTACTSLIKLEFAKAYHQNPLVYVVIPFVMGYFIKDFRAYMQKNTG